jgi:hypothetical protein
MIASADIAKTAESKPSTARPTTARGIKAEP